MTKTLPAPTVGYVVTYLRAGHRKPSHLHVGAGHLTQQLRAWTTAHTGVHHHLRALVDAAHQSGAVLHDGRVLAQFTFTARDYTGSTR